LTVLLLIAVLFVGGTILMRNERPKSENPLLEAQQSMLEQLGFEVQLEPPQAGGLAVQKVAPKSLAQAVGMRVGDVVLAVNDSSVWHALQLQELLDKAQMQGGPVRLMVRNQGVYRTLILGRGTAPPSSRARSGAPAPAPAPARAGG